MSFVVIPDSHLQGDGRRYVREVFSDLFGEVAVVIYLAGASDDYNATAAAREPFIIEDLKSSEIETVLGRDEAPQLRFTSGQELVQAVRRAYTERDKFALARLASWLRKRIQNGDITVAQLRSAFNFTQAQWDAFVARMTALADHYDAIDTAVGE